MSRIDDFEEMLDGYEGREYKPKLEIHGITIDIFKAELCKGNHKLDHRIGFLVGECDDARAEITNVFVPEQTSTPVNTIIDDLEKAAREAKKKGDLIGMVFYTGESEPFVRDTELMFHKLFCDMYGMKNFWMAINSKSYFRLALNGEVYTQK